MLTALLYTILIMPIRSKARNLFPISLMTLSTISVLFIIEVRSETLPMIPSRKLFFVVHLGYDLFACPHCGNESIVPHKCHSKLCTSCGTKETKLRAAHISSIALDAKHRHIVFTIPKHLRGYFIKDSSLLSFLLIAAINTFACVFNDAKYRKTKKSNAPTLIKMTETRSSSVLF